MPAGASVVIDGSEVGVTPWSGNAKTGAHEVAVTSIGYLKDSRTVQIQANRDMELAFALNRAPGPARLNIETEPAGVPVLLDGTNLGTTPFHSDVQAGEHQLELTLAGYRTIAQPIAVDSGQGLSLRYLLQPARTHEAPLLSVSSEPAGAQIWLDGKPAGVTPSKLRTAPGAHEVKLTLDGYVPRVAHPNIPPDREFELRIAAILRPVRGAEQQQHAPTDTELFQAQVERAHTCYVKGDLDCALASYRSAYAYKQDPRVLFNIAQTRRKLGQMPEAASSYRQFLSQTDKKKSKVAKKDIIDEAKRQLAFCENRMLPSLADVPATPAPPEDNTPPRVTHAALRSAMRGKPVRLAAEVTDDRSGVSSVQVCWRNGFHRDFECHAMDNEEADRYGLEIPARAVTDGFAYYLEAYDNANNGPARNGAPDLPHAVLIEDATPVPPAAAAVAEAMPPLPAGGAVPAGYNASTPPRGNPAGVSPRNDADKPGPWNLTVRLGGERSAESSYTDSVLLGRLGVDGSRFFGDWFANATADWRNYRQTYVQQSPTSPRVAVDENRLDFAGRAGYDAGARLLSSGKLELIPYATLSYVRAWNTGYSFDLFGPGAGLRAGYTIAPFAIRGAFDYTYNVLSGTGSSSAFLSPVSSMSWRFGVEVQLSRAYAIELDYVGDTVQFDQVWRVAQGALFGFSTSF
jgi:tetratricopeptide (TPR) repeat protein